jgi:hypothetical protein
VLKTWIFTGARDGNSANLTKVKQIEVKPMLELVTSWIIAGSHPQNYVMGADRTVTKSGSASGSIQAKSSETEGFGTLMQVFNAQAYRGQRLQLSGYVKTQAVDNWAGLWMRVDGQENQVLSFDNMQNRSIKGTTDWSQYNIVLDVPENSSKIAFGVLLDGSGRVWVDELKFETVTRDVQTTDVQSTNQDLPMQPQNLGFEG